MQLDDLDFADDLSLLSHKQQQMQEKTTSVAAASTTNTSNTLARHYQQQLTMGENKPDLRVGRNQEEVLEVDNIHIDESTQLHYKASPHLESSRPKEEERNTKEHITSRNGDKNKKNEQQLDKTGKEC
ncbi:unnamed protein product [Schistosoma margrebowiei]|uniref:Uncharacterized protein n=1 Tax=Schistosoma margrebowiei TaxID=48269 RepID=A0A183LGT9_9TREM|nr:unnamed protein product [Schistosoma margrebowiei]